ncbi:MAG TPA: OsmC family protein, partial [Sunxiuqinia sp.]|nr:OsmC family protein [Sunxiuqinia sp.]
SHGNVEFPFSFKSRFENGVGSNPESLIGAAHAGCFSMAFSNMLAEAGFEPTEVSTTAEIKLDTVDGGPKITESKLIVEAVVPGIDEAKFQEIAEEAKKGCPVSQALSSLKITLDAKLKSE